MALLLGTVFINTTGCKEPPSPLELQYLDTLHYRLKGNERALGLDPDKLNARKRVVREQFMPAVQDTFPEIRKKFMDDFQGIITTYDLFMSKQLLLTSSTELLQDELKELKEKTDAKELSRAEFKESYRELKEKVEINTKNIRTVAKPVYDLEPMWIRFERKFGVN